MSVQKWWLSFATDEGCLGVCVVEARDFTAAVIASHLYGCNPGGEVLGVPIPERATWEQSLPVNVLIGPEDILARGEGEAFHIKDAPEDIRAAFDALLCSKTDKS